MPLYLDINIKLITLVFGGTVLAGYFLPIYLFCDVQYLVGEHDLFGDAISSDDEDDDDDDNDTKDAVDLGEYESEGCVLLIRLVISISGR